MQKAERRSLLDSGREALIMQCVQWIERVVMGEASLGPSVIPVALIGAALLGGRLSVRNGMRILIGVFVVLSIPVVAEGLGSSFGDLAKMSQPQPANVEGGNVRPDLPHADYDPYAGASLDK
jgi:type IV secretory pathway VirB2 component (pilin)